MACKLAQSVRLRATDSLQLAGHFVNPDTGCPGADVSTCSTFHVCGPRQWTPAGHPFCEKITSAAWHSYVRYLPCLWDNYCHARVKTSYDLYTTERCHPLTLNSFPSLMSCALKFQNVISSNWFFSHSFTLVSRWIEFTFDLQSNLFESKIDDEICEEQKYHISLRDEEIMVGERV